MGSCAAWTTACHVSASARRARRLKRNRASLYASSARLCAAKAVRLPRLPLLPRRKLRDFRAVCARFPLGVFVAVLSQFRRGSAVCWSQNCCKEFVYQCAFNSFLSVFQRFSNERTCGLWHEDPAGLLIGWASSASA